MKSTEGDVGYFEVSVASRTAEGGYVDCRIEGIGSDTRKEVLCFLEFRDVFLSCPKQNRVSKVEVRANYSTCSHFGHVIRYREMDVV